MDNKEIIKLLERYQLGQCTEKEQTWIETWYLNQPDETLTNSIEELTNDLDEIEQHLIEYTTQVKYVSIWPKLVVAASVLFILSIGGYFLLQRQTPSTALQDQTVSIVPGGNKAILTLSNGKQVSLTDATLGAISEQGNQTIKKTSDGMITYQSNTLTGQLGKGAYNTITTPRGGQWSVVLPDGTKVMLDAASTLKYPVAFGLAREVQVTGQAYFEVAHHADKPFRVITRDQVIEDIGTAFNVNAYNDEPATKTILLEGIVEIFSPRTGSATGKKNSGLRLSPGQQAVTQNHRISVSRVNTEDAIAWKNGYFRFSDENIESIMRKLSRWYDLEVEYRGSSSQIIFNGEIPRSTSLSGVLKVLEAANIHFTMEGKKLIFKE